MSAVAEPRAGRTTGVASGRPRWGLRVVAGLLALVSVAVTAWQLAGAGDQPTNRILFVAVVVVYLTVGVLIRERRPDNAVGRVILAMGCLIVLYLVLDAYIAGSDGGTGPQSAAWLVSLMDGPTYVTVSLLFLLFPDGRLPSPRWRLLVIGECGLALVVLIWSATKPGVLIYYPQFENPVGRTEAPLSVLGPIAYMLLLLAIALAALSLVERWRRAGSLERAQLKWAASAATLAAVVMVAYSIAYGPGGFSEVFDLLVGLALGFFPIAIGIAILRYHLFEIDRLVSRTIAYLGITGVLVATYAAVILVLQGPLGAMTGGDTISVALSTLVVAALFQPLRRRVQAVVDRRFDRARFDAERTAAAFSERLRDEVDIGTVSADLDGTVREALKPTAIALWLRGTPE